MTDSLKQCYIDVANYFDKKVSIIGVTDTIYSKSELEQELRKSGVLLDKFFLPSDMCYNHTTKPLT